MARILMWHVHGSYTTSMVQGEHDYVLPVVPGRGPDGRGRATSWDWPGNAVEVPISDLRDETFDVVILQRPHEAGLVEEWTSRRVGTDVPAIYLEHNTPKGPAVCTRHPTLDDPRLDAAPIVHVTAFNEMVWDCDDRRTVVIEHGVPDPGSRYTGSEPAAAVVVNEPVRRWRVAGADLILELAGHVPVSVFGMESAALGEMARSRGVPGLDPGRCHDLSQADLHEALARHRLYFHPFRWTSLGLSLIEAMLLGMPVLALSTTAAPESVPRQAGVISNDRSVLRAAAERLLAHPDEARECGQAARAYALDRFAVSRFLRDWDRIVSEVCA